MKNISDIIAEYNRLGIGEQIDYAKFYLYSIITHSTAIEGSTVTEVENRLLFDEGIGAQKPLIEQMMNLDLKAAYEQSLVYAREHTDYSVEMLCGLSALVMKNTGSEYSTMLGSFSASKGELRLLNVSAGIGGGSYLSYQKVPGRLAEFCQWLNTERANVDRNVIEQVYDLSFEAHYRLVNIHPWADGNGRMSRLVMNMIQYEFGAVPSIVKKESKKQYINALERSEEEESSGKFKTFMLQHHCNNLLKQIEEYKQSMNEERHSAKEDGTMDDTMGFAMYTGKNQKMMTPGALNTQKSEISALVSDVQTIVENGLRKAYRDANATTVITYWQIGRRIVEEEQHGQARAEYGKGLIDLLSKEMTAIYPKGYSPRNLRNYRQLYLSFNDLEIWYTRVPNLNWSHYRTLLHVVSDDARYWYVQEASREMWSVRTLARNVGSQYYQRLLQSPRKEAVVAEMLQLTAPLKDDARSFLKDPVVAEFLQLPSNSDFTESEMEKAIIAHLKSFLLEMGRGFAFMYEQYHIATDAGDFFIDLVFYNVVLKCYVLIDLKTKRITHQDVGQLDMYVRMFDELKRTDGDNPTVGLLLCSETSEDIARYSVLNGSNQLFASKYLTYMPTKEELAREIEQQKEIFRLQNRNKEEK